MKKLLLVCLGNICRSPTAHAILRKKTAEQAIMLEIESAGTSASHKGQVPDPRSVREGERLGYSFAGIRSRQVLDNDFAYYDLILAMDTDNLAELKRRCPSAYQHKLQLFLQYHPQYPQYSEVPDPYYGGSKGFSMVLQLIEQGCDGLLQQLK